LQKKGKTKMKKTLTMALLISTAHCLPAQAGPQQEKMKSCAHQYHEKNIPKSEYRKFMSVCLRSDHKVAPAHHAAKHPPATVAKKTTAAAKASSVAKASAAKKASPTAPLKADNPHPVK
jgi:hypothetical protein